MKILAILLNPTIDEILEIKDFHIGGTFKVDNKIIYPVGKAISFSLGIRELIDKSDIIKVIALIGENEIKLFSSFLQSRNINFELISVKGITRSNKTINDPINRTTTHIRSIGFSINDVEIEKLRDKVLKNIEIGDFIIFSGSIPLGAPIDIYFRLIKECKKKGVITILDSSEKALLQGIKANPKIIKPNLEELCQIVNQINLSDIKWINFEEELLIIVNNAKLLLNNDLEVILITMGEKGALCITKNEILYGHIALKNVFDTVGSGDSFLSGFIVKYFFHKSIMECFKNAIACGAANTLIPGPGIFKKYDVKRLIKEVKIRIISE